MKDTRLPRRALVAAAALSTLAFAGCAGMSTESNSTNGSMPGSGSASGVPSASPTDAQVSGISTVKTWELDTSSFLGHAPTVDDIAADKSDMLVLSPADLESKDHPLNKQLTAARGKGPKKILLAMVDVGYVTPSSALWNNSWADSSGKVSVTAPAWLEAPEKTGSTRYRVQYWDSDWQKRVSDEIQRLQKAGFDGVCLDGLGASSAFSSQRSTSIADMATLIESEATDIRKHSTNFYVLALDDAGVADKLTDQQRLAYLKDVDGAVGENVFYHDDKADDSGATQAAAADAKVKTADYDLDPQPDMISALDRYEYAHRPVFVTDQVSSTDKVSDFEERAKARGYLPYVPGQEPAPSTPASPSSTAPSAPSPPAVPAVPPAPAA